METDRCALETGPRCKGLEKEETGTEARENEVVQRERLQLDALVRDSPLRKAVLQDTGTFISCM